MTCWQARVLAVLVACLALPLDAGAARANASAATDPWSAFAGPTFHNYDHEAGLPDEATTAIAQDGTGFMWFGTEGGLARFDGYRFHNYKPKDADPHALPDSWVTALDVDRDDRLWVGTSAGGLARYDRDRDRFDVYPAGRGALSDVHVTAIAQADRARMWVGTENGLDLLDPATRRAVTYRHDARDASSVPDDRILALLRDRTGTLWVGTRGGVAARTRCDALRPRVARSARPRPDRRLPVRRFRRPRLVRDDRSRCVRPQAARRAPAARRRRGRRRRSSRRLDLRDRRGRRRRGLARDVRPRHRRARRTERAYAPYRPHAR